VHQDDTSIYVRYGALSAPKHGRTVMDMQKEMIKTKAKGCRLLLDVFSLSTSVDVTEFQTRICMEGAGKSMKTWL
jgi:hypothetical protein